MEVADGLVVVVDALVVVALVTVVSACRVLTGWYWGEESVGCEMGAEKVVEKVAEKVLG
jgi:hypothetical protein